LDRKPGEQLADGSFARVHYFGCGDSTKSASRRRAQIQSALRLL